MSYTRLRNVGEEEFLLGQRRQDLSDLTDYPNAERTITAAIKIVLAALGGGSTVIAFVVFAPPISILAVIFFAGGSFIYAIKAIRDAYKKRQEEKKLVSDIIAIRDRMRALFTDNFLLTLNHLIDFSKTNKLNEEENERLYTYLFELKEALAVAFPEPHPRYIRAVNTGIYEVGKQVAQFRSLRLDAPCLPNPDYGVISFEEPDQDDEGMSALRVIRKAGNRLLSFMAGASSAAGIGMTIAALCFGVSNPVGWALVGILIGSCVMGLVAVAIDYHFSRREKNTIKKLRQSKRELGTLHKGVGILQQTMKRICCHTQESVDYKRLQKENAELKSQLAVKETQLSGTVLQPATIFGSTVQKTPDSAAIVSSLASADSVNHQPK